jgi:hypothetical protein
MRAALAVLAAALSMIIPMKALAQPAEQSPAGATAPESGLWSMPSEGAVHEASGTRCLASVNGFSTMQFTGAAEPNILGTCAYADESGTGDAGLRVRRYLPGVGESGAEIENDRTLMEPDPAAGAPLFMARMGPATLKDGKMGGRLTITKTRNGYLIDCFADGATLQIASGKIALICSN